MTDDEAMTDHVPAQDRTYNPSDADPAPVDVGTAEGTREALVERIAEAVMRATIAAGYLDAHHIARAVLPLLDAEVAAAASEARAATERLSADLTEAWNAVDETRIEDAGQNATLADYIRRLARTPPANIPDGHAKAIVQIGEWMAHAEGAEAEAESLRARNALLTRRLGEAQQKLHAVTQRALTAEDRLRKVALLADEWTTEAERLQEFADKHQGYYRGVVGTRRNCRDHLLSLLAPSPAATTGEAWGRIVEFASKHSAALSTMGSDPRDPSFAENWCDLVDHFRPAPVSSGEAGTGEAGGPEYVCRCDHDAEDHSLSGCRVCRCRDYDRAPAASSDERDSERDAIADWLDRCAEIDEKSGEPDEGASA